VIEGLERCRGGRRPLDLTGVDLHPRQTRGMLGSLSRPRRGSRAPRAKPSRIETAQGGSGMTAVGSLNRPVSFGDATPSAPPPLHVPRVAPLERPLGRLSFFATLLQNPLRIDRKSTRLNSSH